MAIKDQLLKEVKIHTSRASGPGGQHVNKTESKVELHWDPGASDAVSEQEKILLFKRLGKRLTKEGLLILYCQESRSQLKNREIVEDRFFRLIESSLKPAKKRIRTRRTRSSVEKRLKNKKALSEKKARRRDDL
jgi:ribosome-associated protein